MSLLKKIEIFFISLAYFFYKELDQFKNDLINIIKLHFFVSSKKNANFKRFINSNTRVFKNFNNNAKKKNYILVDAIMGHPGYICTQLIISKFLQKIIGGELIVLNRKNNALIRSVSNSYNIKNFLQFKKDFFIIRLLNFIKVSFSLINIGNLDKINKIKFNNIKIGEITYDHYVRYTGDVFIKKINFKYIYFFFEATEYNKSINNILKKDNYKALVLSETQFIPSAIVFQNALVKKIKVYARYGGPKKIGIRIYNNINQIYFWKQKFEIKDFNTLKENFKNKSAKDGHQIINNRINRIGDDQDLNDTKAAFKKGIQFTKKDLCKKYNWDLKKPIVGIFDHSYTDGLFISGRSIFKTNYEWIKHTFNQIKKVKDVNWLIKPHPIKLSETHKPITSTEIEFDKIIGNNFDNIKLFSSNLSYSDLFDILSVIITGNGTVGIEFATFGVPCIIANNSHYDHLGFTNKPKSKVEYNHLLKNIKNIKNLTNEQKINSRIYTSLELNLSLHDLSLLPKFQTNSEIYYNKNYINFWKNLNKKLKYFNINNDEFYKGLKNQIKNNKTHTLKKKY
tara:strand:+ start:17591 stop:19288 length:1698 start_codon:yes stop_codon:yes gene_type:complete